jgi:hypothetical protein
MAGAEESQATQRARERRAYFCEYERLMGRKLVDGLQARREQGGESENGVFDGEVANEHVDCCVTRERKWKLDRRKGP